MLSCVQLCDLMDCSPPSSSVHRILQARILEWIAISSSRGSSQLRDQTHISYVSCIGRWVLYQLHHLGRPRVLEWVAIPIFLTQGSNLGLPHYRQILYHLSHEGNPSCGILVPQSGIEPLSFVLQGRFLTTGPPEKIPET